MTVSGRQGDVYVLNDTVSFPRDQVTLDLRGATVRIGRARRGNAAARDTLFEVRYRRGVRIVHGRIATSLSPFAGNQSPAKVVIVGGSGNIVSGLHASCSGASLVAIGLGSGHRVEKNIIDAGDVGGFGCTNVVVRDNVLLKSPNNALGFAGFRNSPCRGNQYLYNLISEHGRIAIEDHSPDDPKFNADTVVRGNTIGKPATNASSGTAISAVGARAIIASNVVHDATGYAIEAGGSGTQVTGNQLSWSIAAVGSPPAVAVNTSAPGAPPAHIAANVIRNASSGIVLYANPLLNGAAIADNEIYDAAVTAIDLASPGGTVSATTCSGNHVYFASGPAPEALPRIGIKTTSGASLVENYIHYAEGAASPAADDPIAFVGDEVTLDGNVVDGGGVTPQPVISHSLGASWTGWKLQNNRFIHGATANVGALTSPALSGNTGVSAA